LVYSQEAADPDNDALDVAATINQELVDTTDLIFLRVVNV
jgi:hypothetical protein